MREHSLLYSKIFIEKEGKLKKQQNKEVNSFLNSLIKLFKQLKMLRLKLRKKELEELHKQCLIMLNKVLKIGVQLGIIIN